MRTIELKNNKIFFALLLLISISIIGWLNSSVALISFFGLLAIFLMYYTKEHLYLLYLIVFLSNGFIAKDSYLWGLIGIQQVVTGVTLFSLLFLDKVVTTYDNLPLNIKYANKFFIFLLIYTIYTAFKNAYFGLFDTTILSATTKSINYLLMTLTSIILPTRLFRKRKFYRNAILNILVFFSISALFAKYFNGIGLNTAIETSEQGARFYGFLGNGDANTLALVMVIGLAYLLNVYKRIFHSPSILFTVIIIIVAIGISGSRSGLLLFGLVLLFYIGVSSKVTIFRQRIMLFGFLVLFSLPFLNTNIERMKGVKNEQSYLEGSTSNRVGKWVFYLHYFNEEPITLIRGGNRELTLGWDSRFLVAHNFYIQLVYNGGIIMLTYFLLLLIRVQRRNKLFENINMILVPLIIGIFFISDFGAISFFPILLSGFRSKPSFVRNKITNTVIFPKEHRLISIVN